MLKGEDWKDIYNLIGASTSGLNQMNDFIIELYKYMQIQIKNLQKDNKKIKNELDKIKKQLNTFESKGEE